jgi:hypothetical protein
MSRADHRRTLDKLETQHTTTSGDGRDYRAELLDRLERMASAVMDEGNTWNTYDPAEILADCETRIEQAVADLREAQTEAAALLADRYPLHCDSPDRRRHHAQYVTGRADSAQSRSVMLSNVRDFAAADVASNRPIEPAPTHRPDGCPIAWRPQVVSMSIAQLTALMFSRHES